MIVFETGMDKLPKNCRKCFMVDCSKKWGGNGAMDFSRPSSCPLREMPTRDSAKNILFGQFFYNSDIDKTDIDEALDKLGYKEAGK